MSTDSIPSLSVTVMAFNEEANIGRCLQSVQGIADEVFVLDSFSTDRTVEIARSFGARVERHPFSSYANQRRRMFELASHDWILTLDADEYLSEELKTSIVNARPGKLVDAYTSNRRSKIGNKWLAHGSWYPDRKIRMFDRRKVKVEGFDVHESIEPNPEARVAHLSGDLMHLADESLHTRYQKVNRYSTKAAEGLFQKGRKGSWLRICIKPCVRFISVYFIRLGLLDGFYGYAVARSEAHYVWLREVKLLEMGSNG